MPNAISRTNAKVPRSGVRSTASISVFIMYVSIHDASVSPTALPASARIVDSVRSCRSSRWREAPSESRTAIS